MLYGMPYKGSKGKYVNNFTEQFGTGSVFYDVFGGGGSVSHAVADKFETVVYNESNMRVAEAFRKFITGTVEYSPFVSHEEFNVKAMYDGVIGLCYSFGTGLRSYAYGRDIEPWKQAMHYFLLENDASMFEDMGFHVSIDLTASDIEKNFDRIRDCYEAWFRELFRDSYSDDQIDMYMNTMRKRSVQSFANTEHVTRFRRMQQLKDKPIKNVKVFNKDYRDLEIEPGSVVYCDPPYAETEQYETTGYKRAEFRKDLFIDWCRQLKGKCTVFVSEMSMPDDFEPVWEKKVRNVYNGGNKKNDRVEKLFRLK